ncbi:MAG: hypothetical protein EAZ55_00615 [Cytophagales bacterium]|nr:MAG: hypothetical protein EAZ55_00615 [Cytophagales bacterium]
MYRYIPNFLTLCNAASGLAGILFAMQKQPKMAVYCILAGFVFDVADGALARWLKAYSAIGKELDSLADAITFCALPSVLLYQMFCMYFSAVVAYGVAVVPFLAGIFRLAKFNIDTRQSHYFIGTPTPIFACLVIGLEDYQRNYDFAYNALFLIIISLIAAWLMLWEKPFLSFKMQWKYAWQKQFSALVAVAFLLIFTFSPHFYWFVLAYVVYVLISLWLGSGVRKG